MNEWLDSARSKFAHRTKMYPQSASMEKPVTLLKFATHKDFISSVHMAPYEWQAGLS